MHKLLDNLEERFEKISADILEKTSVNVFLLEDLKAFNALGEAIKHAECYISKHEEKVIAQPASNNGERQEYQYIQEELKDAQKYCSAWVKTGEALYEKLALGEIEHAEALIGLLKNNTPTVKHIHFINEVTNALNAIKAKLNKSVTK